MDFYNKEDVKQLFNFTLKRSTEAFKKNRGY